MSPADGKTGEGEKLQGQGAYAQLLGDIRSGRLLPGARLREIEIATRLGISRTPVREAIRRLEADGLVSYLPRIGAVVRQLSYPEVMELYEMRWVLEGTAARLAARSASGVEIEELAEINAEMIREGQTPQELVTLNRQFHNTLIAAARNRYLVRSVRAIETTLLILGPTTMEDPARVSAAVEEHQAVVNALRGRDEAAAEAMMRAHIESAQRTRLRQLRSHGQLMEGEGPDQA
ncbi:GntR family transcriptional regulator [Chelativorans alearense]|uniref:GntR family transcriptional regulator n=1 Tax=Chelativorans alearense TaxID=2681495 RepID=UPI0013D06607|nr:GntR family transcriptional regulator [Chelativorans alearense]